MMEMMTKAGANLLRNDDEYSKHQEASAASKLLYAAPV